MASTFVSLKNNTGIESQLHDERRTEMIDERDQYTTKLRKCRFLLQVKDVDFIWSLVSLLSTLSKGNKILKDACMMLLIYIYTLKPQEKNHTNIKLRFLCIL